MATETTLLGLRAQLIANMKIMGMGSAEVVTLMNADKHWQAVTVRDSKIVDQLENWYDTKEAALEAMLRMYSYSLYCKFYKQLNFSSSTPPSLAPHLNLIKDHSRYHALIRGTQTMSFSTNSAFRPHPTAASSTAINTNLTSPQCRLPIPHDLLMSESDDLRFQIFSRLRYTSLAQESAEQSLSAVLRLVRGDVETAKWEEEEIEDHLHEEQSYADD
ncbi:hypothetical protein M436DRAFT_66844 [Aureobasidium namibiae CBS 147.97]|uniref:Uncharacterized protein n=1 Tax=Aureobasidium namibiae CBS 147.97 TaxID=1043004 RepID=A0A074WAM2_9PEZI|nr:uncharacterized protein M436DRAFT_66844 [Aureobasidium namibiae CBS 147.97]KEQ70003.1 hypothetical protein M436DRAFT_66844 [Aureobasidium namibiae CBS 147.97]